MLFRSPDSFIDGVSVYETRLNMGDALAEKIRRDYAHLNIDVVIPIPDSSRPSAMQLALGLGINYREGFVKNRYIGRTFIMPGQAVRKKSVRQKLNAARPETIGQASRISGVTPAAVSLLLVHLKKQNKLAAAGNP